MSGLKDMDEDRSLERTLPAPMAATFALGKLCDTPRLPELYRLRFDDPSLTSVRLGRNIAD